jgi:calcium permeable stress-gated cation channel
MRTAAKLQLKKPKTQSKGSKMSSGDADPECAQFALVPKNKRPTHRLPPWGLPFGLPFLGEKVDTIDWATNEIVETNKLLDEERQKMASGGNVHRPIDLLNIVDKVPVVGDILKTRRSESAQNPWNKSTAGFESTMSIGGTPRPSNVSGRLEVPNESEHGRESVEVTRASGDVPLEASPAPHTTPVDSSGFNANYPPLNSAFITFYEQTAAHLAVQALAHHEPYRMSGRHIEVSPEDVIWNNLGLNPYEAKIRIAISYALTTGLVIVWAIPGKPFLLSRCFSEIKQVV